MYIYLYLHIHIYIYIYIYFCIYIYICATHLDLKVEDVKLVPDLSLEILDGPNWLGKLVLRNKTSMRDQISFLNHIINWRSQMCSQHTHN